MNKHNYAWMLAGAFVGFFLNLFVSDSFTFIGLALFVPLAVLSGLLSSLIWKSIKSTFAKYTLSISFFIFSYLLFLFLEFVAIGFYVTQ